MILVMIDYILYTWYISPNECTDPLESRSSQVFPPGCRRSWADSSSGESGFVCWEVAWIPWASADLDSSPLKSPKPPGWMHDSHRHLDQSSGNHARWLRLKDLKGSGTGSRSLSKKCYEPPGRHGSCDEFSIFQLSFSKFLQMSVTSLRSEREASRPYFSSSFRCSLAPNRVARVGHFTCAGAIRL